MQIVWLVMHTVEYDAIFNFMHESIRIHADNAHSAKFSNYVITKLHWLMQFCSVPVNLIEYHSHNTF